MKKLWKWVISLFQKKEGPSPYMIAQMEVGVEETPGPGNTARIIEYHLTTTLRATEDLVPWCSAFMCWCFEQAGIESTRDARARSWLKWGKAVSVPYEGCVVVLKRGRNPAHGHVGFYVTHNNRYVWVMGGNQQNSVSVQKYPISRLLGYREA